MTISLSTGRRGAEAHELHPVLQAAARWCRKLLRAQRRLPSDLQRPVNYGARTKYHDAMTGGCVSHEEDMPWRRPC
jgi:hypothetical protein